MKLVLLLALLTVSECDSMRVKGQTGQNVIMPCKYDKKYHGALSVCWQRGEIPTRGCSNELISTDGDKVETRTSSRYQLLGRLEDGDVSLTIVNLTERDAGRYGCRVEIPGWFNDDKHHFDLSLVTGLTAGDSITPQQTEVTETEGKSVKLTCNYETDYYNIYLHWYRHHSDIQAPQFILFKGAKGYSSEYISDNRYKSETSSTSTDLTITALTLADTALYYCALRRTYGDYALTFGNPISLTVRPKDRPNVTPTLHVLTPLAPSAYPPLPADALGPEVCLATDFHSNEGEMIMNVRGGKASANFSKAVLSTKTKTYYFVGFSNETIHSCELQGVSTNNEADDACSSIYPEKAKLNFYLLVMNGVRVLFTKTLAFNTILTIRGLLV